MIKQKSLFFAVFLFGLVLAVTLTTGLNMAKATWSEPSATPPGSNVDPFTRTLKNILDTNPDASTFSNTVKGDVKIGSAANTVNMYLLGGEFKAKWLHATEPGNNFIAGNLGIGVAAPVDKLEVNGTVKATAFVYTSDRSLKDNIQPIFNSLERVLQLKGVSFNWKNSNRKDVGLIAQDVEKIFPELVGTGSDGLKSLEYGNLIAPLVEAIKEQQKIINSLEQRIKALEDAK